MPDDDKVTTREYFQKQIDWLDRHIAKQLDFMDKQVILAREDLERRTQLAKEDIDRRMVELNNLRKEVTEDRGRLVEKAAYDPWRDSVEKRMASGEGRTGLSSILWALGGSIAAGIIIALALKLLK